MKTWTRLVAARLCGHCGAQLLRGDPVQTIQVGTVTRRLIRCTACAGEAPPDLPAVVVPSRTTKAMQPLSVAIPGVVEKLRGKV